LRRRAKLIIGVVATLALLICGATYLVLIEWPSTTGGQPMVQQGCCGTELLRSGEPTRTLWLGEYFYEVRFYNASGGEVALVGASIQYGGPPQPGYRLTVSLGHVIETWYIMLDGPDPSTTHLESLSLTFNFNRRIETLPFPLWLLTPIERYGPSNVSSSFSLESRIIDPERGVLLLNFSRLRNLEMPPTSPMWSWISFEFLMAQEHVHVFTLEVSFTLRLPSGGKVMYEKGTTTLDFQRPVGAALQEVDPLVFHPLTAAIPRKMATYHPSSSPVTTPRHSNQSTFH
jgi:hypothetical protein